MSIELLIRILRDPNARPDERDDAAMDLAGYEGKEVEAALEAVANDETTPEIVRASCGESLAEIWVRAGSANRQILERLSGVARSEAEARLNAERLP